MIILSSRPVGLDRSRIPLTFIIAEHVLCAMHHSMDLIARGCNWRVLFVSTVEGKGNKGDAVTGRRQSGTSVNFHFTNSAKALLSTSNHGPMRAVCAELPANKNKIPMLRSRVNTSTANFKSSQAASSICDGTLSSSSSHSLLSHLILRSRPLTS